MLESPDLTTITPSAPIANDTHGGRAKCLQRLMRLELPVPPSLALSFKTVHDIASGAMPDVAGMLAQFPPDALLCVRPSSQDPDWGGPGAVLNIGINDAHYERLRLELNDAAAQALYLRFIRGYALDVARLDPDVFDDIHGPDAVAQSLAAYEDEAGEPFPQDPARQLSDVLLSMARAWGGTSARLLRQAKGAPVDAGLGLVVQQMIAGVGSGECGAGVLQLIEPETGIPQITGRYLPQSQGREALDADAAAYFLERDARGPSLEESVPQAFADLKACALLMRTRLRAEMQAEFVIQDGQVHILDGVLVPLSSRATVRVAVDLARDGVIPRDEALMRVPPRTLSELLHRHVHPRHARDVIARGIAASPGAAVGRLVFSSEDAQASAARGEGCILVRRETSPEDIRGMQAAAGVITERGGITSHAAVIGRGMGLPCVVGAQTLRLDADKRQFTAPDGRVFRAGDTVTLDGSGGQILAGEARLIEAAQDEAFQTLMGWAREVSDIGVRANADTPADATTARNFHAQGIGLCRTEHMFFEGNRLTVMREMIFADGEDDRRDALAQLLPMQRGDFVQLFRIMAGHPVCIRLLDPPLHEFLPTGRKAQRELADALGLSLSAVTKRVEAMGEYNPMLGMRGVRLGVTWPEIYDMQARAIFEATAEVARDGIQVVPEIMIPLVSAKREVELVKARIDTLAAAVRAEAGVDFDFRLGIMVETPRAALRAHEIAPMVSFMSYGTNDMTQMTYGLSRDDAGRFMSQYVQQEVFAEDPFLTLDTEGVGELLRIGAERARAAAPDVTLSICGEHGGDPVSIDFCRDSGFTYVSCSPFRVPVAQLAAAQLALRGKSAGTG